jgi:hypothetical protein
MAATINRHVLDLPPQRKTEVEKDDEWHEQCIEALIGMSIFSRDEHHYRDLLSKTYGYYSGEIQAEDYDHVLRPYGKKRKNMPAKMQNYNIIKPSIDLLLGEKAKRPYSFVVRVSNPDITTKKERALQEALVENLQAQFVNELRRIGYSDEEIQEVPPTEEIAEAFEKDYVDERALIGQASLQYLSDHLELPRKFREAFFHFLVSGRVVTEKFINADRVEEFVINPLDADWDKSPDTEFIEDGEWAVIRQLCTIPDVLDTYYDDLTEEQIDYLERRIGTTPHGYLWQTDRDDGLHDSRGFTGGRGNAFNNRYVEVYRTYWKSMTQIGVRRYLSPFGSWEKEVVTGSYTPGPGENIEWYWVNEVRQGTRIGEDIYIDYGAHESQRRSMDNHSKCKLPVNGRKYSDKNAKPISLVMLGMPYQLLYNVYHYRLELAIAKAKDMVAHFDYNAIPSELGIDNWLYYIDALGFAFSSGPKDGEPQGSSTHKSVLDLSAKNIEQYMGLLNMIQQQWDDLAGISRQRKGLTAPYELKSTTEQSIIQSSFITEDYFMKFTEFEERELEGLLDLSKIAWMNNVVGSYVMPDNTVGILEVDGIAHSETEYGIHVVQSGKESDNVNFLKAMLQQMAGQGALPLSMVAEILNAPSFATIRDKIAEAEKTQAELAEQQQQMEQEQQAAQIQAQQQQQMFEAEQKELDRQSAENIALIGAQSRAQGSDSFNADSDGDGQADIVEAFGDTMDQQRKIASDEKKLEKDLAFKREQLNETRRHNKAQEEIARNKPKPSSSS